jgi:hypothetical protein
MLGEQPMIPASEQRQAPRISHWHRQPRVHEALPEVDVDQRVRHLLRRSPPSTLIMDECGRNRIEACHLLPLQFHRAKREDHVEK